MLLSELLATSELGLRVHVAPGHGVDPEIGRMITSDLLEPGRYLHPGDAVLTGLMWRRRPTDSETFVASLTGAGAAIVLAGKAQFGEIPEDLSRACAAAGLILVEVATEVSFTEITDFVTARDSEAWHATASLALARQRQLLDAIASGDSLDKLVQRVATEIGHDCRIITATGHHVVPGPGELDGATLDAVTADLLAASRLPSTVSIERVAVSIEAVTASDAGEQVDQKTHSCFAIGPGLGHRWQSWFLVVEGDHRRWPRDDVDAVNELCAFAALDRSRREEGLRARRPLVDDLLELIYSGAAQRTIITRLSQAGFNTGEPVAVLMADVSGPEQPATGDPASGRDGGTDDPGRGEDALVVLSDLVAAIGPDSRSPRPGPAASHDSGHPDSGRQDSRHQDVALPNILATVREGIAVALVPDRDELPERIRRALHRLTPGLGRTRLAVGISGAGGAEALAGALDEARFALRVARTADRPVSVVSSADVTSHVLLLANVPDDVRRTFAQRVLGPVIAQDERSGGELLGTLSEFLAQSGSWTRVAKALHLHVNTVRYRIERVEDLTGRDLSRFEDRVDVFLALKSL